MRIWRCTNSDCTAETVYGTDFESDVPVCPKCQLDGRAPEGRGVILPLVAVHLLVKDPSGPVIGRGSRYKILCNPTLKLGQFQATGEAASASCPDCRRHSDFPHDQVVDASMMPDWRMGREIKELS